MTKILLTSRTLDDLQEIYDHSEIEWGEETAAKYIRSFEDAFKLLKENPGLLRVKDKISSKFTVYNVRQHYLICDIIDQDIYVLTVRHVSMNLLERLQELEPELDNEAEILRNRLKSNG